MSEKTPIARIHHGEPLSLEGAEPVETIAESGTEPTAAPPLPEVPSWPFDFIFPELACDDSKTLAAIKDRDVVADLIALGQPEVMKDDPNHIPGVPTPTIYTFFGQFVDHDITHEKGTECTVLSPDLKPLPCAKARALRNARTPNLELDSVYGSVSGVIAPRDPDDPEKLRVDRVSKPNLLPPGKGEKNDLPRWKKTDNPLTDRVALIGDVRNDENVITAQLHVAFLHAHNALIDRGYSFAKARRKLIQHYQWIVLEDFLPRVADPAIVKKIRTKGAKFFKPSREEFFTPLEFSVAAYRFGHSKVRPSYEDYNVVIGPADLLMIFTFTKFSGNLSGEKNSHILGNWVIDWKGFLNSDKGKYFSRPTDTRLAIDLFNLPMEQGVKLPPWKKNLAVRNLLRGYLLRMPTGQAVAEAMNKKDQSISALTPEQITSVVTNEQYAVMKDAGFLDRTPLWFYILAEADYCNHGHHLGPVGSTIVAETLIGILRYSDYSILATPGWRPTLGLTPGKFDLEDLLILAGVY